MNKFINTHLNIIFFIINISLLTLTLYVLVAFSINQNIKTQTKCHLRVATIMAAEYAQLNELNLPTEVINNHINNLNLEINSTAYITDSIGNIVRVYRGNDRLIGETIPHVIVSKALLGNTTTSIDYISGFFSDKRILIAMPIYIDGQLDGSLLVISSKEKINFRNYNTFLFSLLILILLFFLTSYLHYLTINKKNLLVINNLNLATKKISRGDFSTEIITNQSGPIGDLANNVNKMSHELSCLEHNRIDYIANISHDFRSPLTSIKGFVEAMLDGTIPQECYDHYLNIIHDEAERLTTLTSELLVLNTLASDRNTLEMVHFNIHTVISKISHQFEKNIKDKYIQITFDFDENAADAYGDLNQIYRVVHNLINNSIKFTNNGGTILISTEFEMINSKIKVSVSDTGIGIAPSNLPYIFNRFYKGDKSRGRDKSSGIGLSIVKEIINAHDQEIFVESVLGKGTTFTFTIDKYLDE